MSIELEGARRFAAEKLCLSSETKGGGGDEKVGDLGYVSLGCTGIR